MTEPPRGEPAPQPEGDQSEAPWGRRRDRRERHWQHRPPWWPAGEPWPPQGRRTGPPWSGRWFRRLFGLFVLVFFGAVGLATLLVWLIVWALGWLPAPTGSVLLAVAATAAVVVGWGVVLMAAVRALRQVTRPLDDLVAAAGQVAQGDYGVRVDERGPRELRSLAHAFNVMGARLQATDTQRRDLLADVTHELQTPVTVIQGTLEGLLDGVYPRDDARLGALLDETRVLARLIEDLRTLALAESGALALAREPTDLAALAAETAAAYRAQADAAGVRLELALPAEPLVLEVDPARLREVLANLLGNALRYTPAGGLVTVSLAPQSDPRGAVLAVRDTGAGIAAEDLPHIFERFYKSSGSAGMGLGLAIARNLIRAHGGAITAESTVGQGTTVRVVLPAE
jgi:signal transduction histidine kinase